MSALGQKRTLRSVRLMSALPPKADIAERHRDVCFVPKADILRCSKLQPLQLLSRASEHPIMANTPNRVF